MSKKDFFRIIIRLFGLYSLITTLFSAIPTILNSSYMGFDVWFVLTVLGIVAIICCIFIFLLFKVDVIIKWLRLDKGFDDDRIEFGNVDSVKLVSFAIILIGGSLIVNYFPGFIYNCYLAFKTAVERKGTDDFFDTYTYSQKVEYFEWVISAMNLVIGYLFLTNYQSIANWITKLNRKNSDK